MKSFFNLLIVLALIGCGGESRKIDFNNLSLVWGDEFNGNGAPDPTKWVFEEGFVRNNEHQWYQSPNATQKDGYLIIEGRRESRPNPNYLADSDNWKINRDSLHYTSSCIKSVGKYSFLYGRLEVRAKIPTASGSWPAIWTLGDAMQWPSCGEVDIMEYYRVNDEPTILANVAWGSDKEYDAIWNTNHHPYSKFLEKDPDWGSKFHIWRMDWNSDFIRIYLDDCLVCESNLTETINGVLGDRRNPFHQPHYILLNLALGGFNGGKIDDSAFPMQYVIDYVRVYQ